MWIKCKDKLPPIDKHVLVIDKQGYMKVAYRINNDNWNNSWGIDWTTHWMELPSKD
jgi:hypothetical protein